MTPTLPTVTEKVQIDRTTLGRALAHYFSAQTGTDIYPHQIVAMTNVGPQQEVTDIYKLHVTVSNPEVKIARGEPSVSSTE